MTKEVSTTLYKINWQSLIEGALDHSNWGKVFTIYHSGDFKVTLSVFSILVNSSKVGFVTTVYSEGERHGSSFQIPWEEDHFNESVFTEALFRAVQEATDEISVDILYASKLPGLLYEEENSIRDIREEVYLDALATLGLTEDTVGESIKKLVLGYVGEATSIPYSVFSAYPASSRYEGYYQTEYLKGVGSTIRVKPGTVNKVGEHSGLSLDKQGLIEFAISKEMSDVAKYKSTDFVEKLAKLDKQMLALKEELASN